MNALPSKLWTIDEVSKYLRVKSSVIRYWIKTRSIPFIQIGREYRFDPSDIRAWLEKKKKNSLFDNLNLVL